MPTPRKVEAVETLRAKLANAQAVVLADFSGLDVGKISQLRREFRKNDADFIVVKNTLGLIAAKECGMAGLEPYLEGPTGWAVTSADPTAPARVIKEFSRTHTLPKVKGGFIDGVVISPEEVVKIADLPSKPVLVAQIMGLIQSPIQGIAGSIHAVMTYLAVAVDEIRKQKEAAGKS
ncbi:MAG: 50S ribosomal protein L10 [Candidatus Eisenbacteria bacterium]|nr:50S ribosomal protein L10 [Candidatus Eisenbacteria bacterium]